MTNDSVQTDVSTPARLPRNGARWGAIVLCSAAVLGLWIEVRFAVFAQQGGGGATAVPELPFRGQLLTPQGEPVPEGSMTVRFRLYDMQTAGTQRWDSGNLPIVVGRDGQIDTLLSGGTPALSTVDFSEKLFLGIRIDNPHDGIRTTDPSHPEMARIPIVPALYAFKSTTATLLANRSINEVVPIGTVLPWFGTGTPPTDWMLCNGGTVPAPVDPGLRDANTGQAGTQVPNLNGANSATRYFLRGSSSPGPSTAGTATTADHTIPASTWTHSHRWSTLDADEVWKSWRSDGITIKNMMNWGNGIDNIGDDEIYPIAPVEGTGGVQDFYTENGGPAQGYIVPGQNNLPPHFDVQYIIKIK